MAYRKLSHNIAVYLACLLALSGCLSVPSSPSAHFYKLSVPAPAEADKITGSLNAVIGIGPVSIPEYLNRPQMVTQRKDNTLEFAQFERWGEPLSDGIARVVAENISRLLPGASVEIYPWDSSLPVKYQVIVKIIQIDAQLGGEVVFASSWSVLEAQTKKALLIKKSEYRKPLSSSSYPALVEAIGAACQELSKKIAETLASLAAQA